MRARNARNVMVHNAGSQARATWDSKFVRHYRRGSATTLLLGLHEVRGKRVEKEPFWADLGWVPSVSRNVYFPYCLPYASGAVPEEAMVLREIGDCRYSNLGSGERANRA
jgi:hypothetical protein